MDGKFGKALSFDGVDDWVKVDKIFTFRDFTVSIWFKTDYNGRQTLIQTTDGSRWGLTGFIIEILSLNDIETDYRAKYPNKCELHAHKALEPNWHHVVLVRDTQNIIGMLYVDGILYASCDDPDPNLDIKTQSFLRIGYGYYAPGNYEKYFDGIIDEIRIYNRALSEEEIRALYEQGVTPRPKLAIEMDIDTSLKQGEVREGTIRVENIGNSDAKSVKVRLFSEGLGIDVEKSYAKIPSGEAREFLFEVNANEAGTFKLSAYAEYWDDKGNKYVETADKFVHVEAVVLPTSQPTSQAQETPEARETARPAGFYAIFASLLMAVSYFLIRLKGKKN